MEAHYGHYSCLLSCCDVQMTCSCTVHTVLHIHQGNSIKLLLKLWGRYGVCWACLLNCYQGLHRTTKHTPWGSQYCQAAGFSGLNHSWKVKRRMTGESRLNSFCNSHLGAVACITPTAGLHISVFVQSHNANEAAGSDAKTITFEHQTCEHAHRRPA